MITVIKVFTFNNETESLLEAYLALNSRVFRFIGKNFLPAVNPCSGLSRLGKAGLF